ncbi:MAG: hypothetical protein V4736_05130, partial [Bdellovibrionota bacterium]
MKNVIAILALFASVTAFANGDVKIPKDAVSVRPITGEVVSIATPAPNCPPNAMCAPVGIAKVKFTLSSCVNTLGPVTYNVKHDGLGKTLVTVSAVELQSKDAPVVRCWRAEVVTVELFLGVGFYSADDTTVEFLSNV